MSKNHQQAGRQNFIKNGREICLLCGGEGYVTSPTWTDRARAGGNASVDAIKHGAPSMSKRSRMGGGRPKIKTLRELMTEKLGIFDENST